jgi:hypothetical protein
VEVAGYDLMLRYSRPEWPVANTNLTYTTIDVVQIGHHDFMSSVDGNLSVIPKNGAKPVWEFLEAYCREKGVALRVEGVNNDQLRRKLIARRGFENEGYYNSTSIIKTLGAPGTAHDQMFHNKVDAL